MRGSVIEVLFYLFDTILPKQTDHETDLNQMVYRLKEAGFTNEEVGRAMDWFYELGQMDEYQPQPKMDNSIRIFSSYEQYIINYEGQDFLHNMCCEGILDATLREKVIERAIALEEPLSLETLRWVTLMVVMNTGTDLPDAQVSWMIADEMKIIQ